MTINENIVKAIWSQNDIALTFFVLPITAHYSSLYTYI